MLSITGSMNIHKIGKMLKSTSEWPFLKKLTTKSKNTMLIQLKPMKWA